MANEIVLSIGSNSADKSIQMLNCIEWLYSRLQEVRVSTVYATPALNGKDADYLNAVVIAKSEMEFDECKQIMKQYEASCGRTIESKVNGSIPIDIDIVICNNDIKKNNDLNQTYFQKGWCELTEKQ